MTSDTIATPKRKRRVRHDLTSEAASSKAAAAPATAGRSRIETADKTAMPLSPVIGWFLVCFLLGEGIAVAGQFVGARWLQWFGPIAAMFIYILIGVGRRWARSTTLREEFADTTYFLGFAFTLASLLVLFGLPAILGQQVGAQDIVDRFGVALGASVIGLIARAVIEGIGSSSGAAGSDHTEAIQQASHRLTTELGKASDSFLTLTSTLEGRLRDMLETTEQQLKKVRDLNQDFVDDLAKSQEGLRDAGASVSSGSATVSAAVGRFADQVGTFGQEFQQTVNKTVSQTQTAISDFAEAVQAVKAIGASSRQLEQVAGAVRVRVETSASQVSDELSEAARQVRAMGGAVSSVGGQFDSLQQTSARGASLLNEAIAKQMADLKQLLTEAATEAGKEVKESARQGAAQLNEDLDKARNEFANSVIRFGKELETLQEIMRR